jgi:ribonuclease HI
VTEQRPDPARPPAAGTPAHGAGGAAYPLVAVYADESCLGNGKRSDNPGGAGGLVEYRRPDGEIVRRDFWVSEPATTNNRMALRSAIEAFTALSAKGQRFSVVFTSDSRYLVDGMSDWVYGWSRRGWRKADGKPVENLELWQRALAAVTGGGHQVQWRWVRGHVGHPQNEYANHLATRAAAAQSCSGGLVASGYEEWSEGLRAKGRLKGSPDPFPDRERFRADRALPSVLAARV